MFATARIAAVAASCALLSAHAFAHAYPVTSDPAKGATVHTAPAEVAIEFDDELEPKFSTIVVHDAKGATVSNGAASVPASDAKHLSVPLKALSPGTYTVLWTATDTDTHKTKGSFTFKVSP